jgi:predicted transcriptional regulator of viral defense system
MNTQYTNGQGISKGHRELLDRLHQERQAPFSPEEIASAWNMSPVRTRRLLAHWASRGWLSRLRRGLYVTVPLGTRHPAELSEDPWIIAHRLFAPCYIGGWSACEHWGLTEQIFRGVVVFSTRKVHDRKPTIKETPYVIKTIPEKHLFGTTGMWRRDMKVQVSTPARTIADLLDDPTVGGGMRHVAEIVARFFTGEHRNDAGLLEAIAPLNNRTIYKRLGYLIEALKLEAPNVLAYCQEYLSAGYSKLDPSVAVQGPLIRRWRLRLNVGIRSEELTP